MIEVVNFTKRYGDFVAVDDLSFTIGQGEIFGFIGPNGAGKSTTIRFLATLLRPTSGEGRIGGHSVTADPMAVRRVIGFMPDDFGVYDGMKVWEFLDFFAVAYEIPRTSRKKIIGEVLELLDLTHKKDDYVNGLSKGMKQRLCLAKTLVHDPPVLILDEPASGLDPRARLEMKALLGELRRMGKTILISSHILSELADFCTSIGIIERGKLLAAGSIQDIQQQIRSHRVLKVTSARRDHRPRRGYPPRRSLDPPGGDLRPHGECRVRGTRRRHGPSARPADPVGDRGPVVRRRAAQPRGGLHDDHQGNRLASDRPSRYRYRIQFRHVRDTMFLRDNPVLTRELLVTLRSSLRLRAAVAVCRRPRALSFTFTGRRARTACGRSVRAWPGGSSTSSFWGSSFSVALVAPTFAAGSITGEKERKTYEMLLASPLRPGDDPDRQAAQLAERTWCS